MSTPDHETIHILEILDFPRREQPLSPDPEIVPVEKGGGHFYTPHVSPIIVSPEKLVGAIKGIAPGTNPVLASVGSGKGAIRTLTPNLGNFADIDLPLFELNVKGGPDGDRAFPPLEVSAQLLPGMGGDFSLPKLTMSARLGGTGQASITLPMIEAQNVNRAHLRLPMLEVRSGYVLYADISLPKLQTDIKVILGGLSDITLPCLVANQYTGEKINLPALTVEASGGPVVGVNLPKLTVESKLIKDNTLNADLTFKQLKVEASLFGHNNLVLPKLQVSSSVSQENIANADIVLKKLIVSSGGFGDPLPINSNIVLKAIKVSASGWPAGVLSANLKLPALKVKTSCVASNLLRVEAGLPVFEVNSGGYIDGDIDVDIALPKLIVASNCRQSTGEYIIKYTNPRPGGSGEEQADPVGIILGYDQ